MPCCHAVRETYASGAVQSYLLPAQARRVMRNKSLDLIEKWKQEHGEGANGKPKGRGAAGAAAQPMWSPTLPPRRGVLRLPAAPVQNSPGGQERRSPDPPLPPLPPPPPLQIETRVANATPACRQARERCCRRHRAGQLPGPHAGGAPQRQEGRAHDRPAGEGWEALSGWWVGMWVCTNRLLGMPSDGCAAPHHAAPCCVNPLCLPPPPPPPPQIAVQSDTFMMAGFEVRFAAGGRFAARTLVGVRAGTRLRAAALQHAVGGVLLALLRLVAPMLLPWTRLPAAAADDGQHAGVCGVPPGRQPRGTEGDALPHPPALARGLGHPLPTPSALAKGLGRCPAREAYCG